MITQCQQFCLSFQFGVMMESFIIWEQSQVVRNRDHQFHAWLCRNCFLLNTSPGLLTFFYCKRALPRTLSELISNEFQKFRFWLSGHVLAQQVWNFLEEKIVIFTQIIAFIKMSSWTIGAKKLVRVFESNLTPKGQKYDLLRLITAIHFG